MPYGTKHLDQFANLAEMYWLMLRLFNDPEFAKDVAAAARLMEKYGD
jgi:hypothetical protein